MPVLTGAGNAGCDSPVTLVLTLHTCGPRDADFLMERRTLMRVDGRVTSVFSAEKKIFRSGTKTICLRHGLLGLCVAALPVIGVMAGFVPFSDRGALQDAVAEEAKSLLVTPTLQSGDGLQMYLLLLGPFVWRKHGHSEQGRANPRTVASLLLFFLAVLQRCPCHFCVPQLDLLLRLCLLHHNVACCCDMVGLCTLKENVICKYFGLDSISPLCSGDGQLEAISFLAPTSSKEKTNKKSYFHKKKIDRLSLDAYFGSTVSNLQRCAALPVICYCDHEQLLKLLPFMISSPFQQDLSFLGLIPALQVKQL
ncbi:hypothetical protein Anapl_17797 [Anas platyrhynchos]|uniref:Uncharacterized protein n=1 Tax=Anas platyrhynchos TaxID=8839 RepID=R0KZ25_ANAPL|nr:hypothetical protein Anapl_17797 [Anas platyrhynchos]